MSIFIFSIIAIFGIAGFVVRARIMNIVRGLGFHAAATWLNFTGQIWPAIRGTVLISLVILGIPWVIMLIIMSSIGMYANSLPSALVITFLLPVWFLTFVVPTFVKKIYIGALVVAVGIIVFGLWSPVNKVTYDNWSQSKKEVIAGSFNKKSLILGTMPANSYGYSDQEVPIPVWRFDKTTEVKIVDLNYRPNSKDSTSEAMAKIMMKNKVGSYLGGNIVCVTLRELTVNQ